MKPQQFTIPQQFMVGEIKIDTKAQLERTYMRLLLDAFVPYQEAMLAYLDELLVKHDPQLVQRQLDELQKQDRKKSKEWKQTHLLLQQTDESEHEKIIGRLLDIHDEERALHQTHMELIEKINSETRSVEPHSLVKGGGGLEKNDGPRQDVLLQNRTPEPMDASKQVCPNAACSARGKLGAGKSSLRGRNRPRYRCHKSGQREPVCFGKNFRPQGVS